MWKRRCRCRCRCRPIRLLTSRLGFTRTRRLSVVVRGRVRCQRAASHRSTVAIIVDQQTTRVETVPVKAFDDPRKVSQLHLQSWYKTQNNFRSVENEISKREWKSLLGQFSTIVLVLEEEASSGDVVHLPKKSEWKFTRSARFVHKQMMFHTHLF